MKVHVGGKALRLVQGDITSQKVDVVEAANSSLIGLRALVYLQMTAKP